jgi:hypothetical protein
MVLQWYYSGYNGMPTHTHLLPDGVQDSGPGPHQRTVGEHASPVSAEQCEVHVGRGESPPPRLASGLRLIGFPGFPIQCQTEYAHHTHRCLLLFAYVFK